jgi:4-amino-4-deoxy-L-arabinose transferase-like glycosyltransferase
MPRFRVYLFSLLVCCGILYLAGNGATSLWDRDEPRYAQASKQMLESGDWVMPWFLNEPRTNKPVGIYWLQAASMAVFDNPTFAARFPSAVAMVLLVGLMAWQVRKTSGDERAILTALILATSALSIAAAKMSITDSVLALCITTAQLALFHLWRGRHSFGVYATLGLSVGAAGLVKGPVVLGVLATTALALLALALLDRWRRPGAVIPVSMLQPLPPARPFRWWLPLLSLALVVAVVSPWIWMMESRTPGYVLNTIWQEVVVRAKKPQEGHSGPPGFYLLTMFGTLMPWSLMMPAALVCAFRHRKDQTVRFALAAFVGPWLMFELVQTKLPHYILPTFPFLAYLLADTICRCAKRQIYDLSDRPFTIATKFFAVILALLALVPIVGAVVELRYMNSTALLLPAGLMAAIGLVWAIFVWRFFARRELIPATLVLAVGFATVVLAAYTTYLPQASFLQLPKRVAAELTRLGANTPGSVVMIDFKEPSLAFYQGGTIREAADDYLLKSTTQTPWVVLTEQIYHAMPAEVSGQLEVVASLEGWAYADSGRWVNVLIAKNHNGDPR